jgi:hypothetical protein
MATTRKRARTEEGQFKGDDPATPERNEAYVQDLPLTVDSLAAFMEIEQPDRERLGLALRLAKEAALAVTGRPVGDTAPHGIRHGVHMLAAQLLIRDQLDAAPQGAEIPGVVRYLWKTADAGR